MLSVVAGMTDTMKRVRRFLIGSVPSDAKRVVHAARQMTEEATKLKSEIASSSHIAPDECTAPQAYGCNWRKRHVL